ncbi:bacterial proteasome activator family protein [Parafrankia discariae]|uniref:bacterial proteasome activator family protein n=1 Tax=Parafrankia discariae TaxID=365528 RepID=UPI00036BE61C|nr:bacterial proteasome activator family protein [Parafrankia discariae]
MTDQPEPRVVVVGPDGALQEVPGAVGVPLTPSAGRGGRGGAAGPGEGKNPFADMVSQPDKVMRIGTMIKQLLEEVRAAPLDDASRVRLRRIHQSSITELSDGLAPELRAELDRLSLPFDEDSTPSDGELRIAQAQLVGWLEGLFHGLQTALFAQQMAARAQLEEMRRRALPSGQQQSDNEPFGGTYL